MPGKLYKANYYIFFSAEASNLDIGDIILFIKYGPYTKQSSLKRMYCFHENKILHRIVGDKHVKWFDAI